MKIQEVKSHKLKDFVCLCCMIYLLTSYELCIPYTLLNLYKMTTTNTCRANNTHLLHVHSSSYQDKHCRRNVAKPHDALHSPPDKQTTDPRRRFRVTDADPATEQIRDNVADLERVQI